MSDINWKTNIRKINIEKYKTIKNKKQHKEIQTARNMYEKNSILSHEGVSSFRPVVSTFVTIVTNRKCEGNVWCPSGQQW